MSHFFRPLALALLWAGTVSAQTGTNAFSLRPTLVLAGGVATGSGDTTTATAELNEPDHVGDPAGRSIWWKWTAPSSGLTEIDTIGSLFFTRLAVYVDAGSLVAITPVAANLETVGTPNYDSLVRFVAQSGTTYAIAVDGEYNSNTGSVDFGSVTLTLRRPGPGAAPANDTFAAATVLASQASVTASGDNTSASVERSEPDPEITKYPSGPGRSVWFSWVAPTAGYYTVSVDAAAGGDWSPALGVYTGSSLGALVVVDKGENLSFEPVNYDSGLVDATFLATAGQTYRLQVASLSFITSFGIFDLSIAPALRPANDDFSAADDLGSATLAARQSTLLDGTRQSGEPDHFLNAMIDPSHSSSTIWWKWVAPSATPVTVDTRGSDGDTLLAVYRGTSLGSLVLVDTSDDINFAAICYSSALTFTPIAGQTYQFAVTGYSQGSRTRFHLVTGPRGLPYQSWLMDYPELVDEAADRDADPDGDGLDNLTELMLNTNPLVNSYTNAADAPRLQRTNVENGSLFLDIGYSIENLNGLSDGLGAGGTPISVEGQSSVDLKTWTAVPAADVGQNPDSAFVGTVMTEGQLTFLRFSLHDSNPYP